MGKYQWKLFALCGGGWMAGKSSKCHIGGSITKSDNR
jgi:hypothetical protein